MVKGPLRKRHLRELKSDPGKYIVIFLILLLSIGEISGYLVADESMLTAYNESFVKYNIEDGNFTAEKKLNQRQKQAVRDAGAEEGEAYFRRILTTQEAHETECAELGTVTDGYLAFNIPPYSAAVISNRE